MIILRTPETMPPVKVNQKEFPNGTHVTKEPLPTQVQPQPLVTWDRISDCVNHCDEDSQTLDEHYALERLASIPPASNHWVND